MNELYAALLSWAVTLSGFPMPEHPPEVVHKPHSFFVERACNGKECKVLGWYDGGRSVYIDDRLDPQNSLQVVDHFVHDDGAGQQVMHWEQEAYAVQREYILRQGIYLPVGRAIQHAGCDPAQVPAPDRAPVTWEN